MANQEIFTRLYDRLSSGRRAREEELKDSARQLLRITKEAIDYTHSYGKFVPEIIEIDKQLRGIMKGEGK